MNTPAVMSRLQPPRIVLLDDERHMLQLYELYLRDWFHEPELVGFRNGDAAWLELEHAAADLLITDWRHPGLDAGDLVRKLAAARMKVPVLIISACDADCVRELGGLGFKVAFLQKPFGYKQLWKAVNELAGPCDFPAHSTEYIRQFA